VYDGQPEAYYHSPAVDGTLLRKPVWDVIKAGELAAIPFIIGSNADEWYASTPADVGSEDIAGWVRDKHFLNTPDALAAIADEPDPREAIDRIDSAEYMLCPSQVLAAFQSKLHGNGWVYYFSRVREGDAGAEVRAYHGAELPYVFGTHDAWMTTTATDWHLAEQMMSYWFNLAASGDPNGDGLAEWPPFTGPQGLVMEFSDSAVPRPPPEPALCRIFGEAVSAAPPSGSSQRP
jgi:para-nitrobenzyl esterase